MTKVDILAADSFTELVTDRLAEILKKREHGTPFHLFLSGGSTPKPIYRSLSDRDIDWSEVHFWLGDERFVPHDHSESNFRMVKEQLLDRIEISTKQIHPWPILSAPVLSAETYDREFRRTFLHEGQPLSLQLLGMGDDGHTASLFPGSRALEEEERMCVENPVAGKESVRLTLTYPALALSRRVIFVLKGQDKAGVLKEVLEEGKHPAAQVKGVGQPEFWVDTAAAAQLTDNPKGEKKSS